MTASPATTMTTETVLSRGQVGILADLFRMSRYHDKKCLEVERIMDSFIGEVPDDTRIDLQNAIDDLLGEVSELHAAIAAAAVAWTRPIPEPVATIAAESGELHTASGPIRDLFEGSGIFERFVSPEGETL